MPIESDDLFLLQRGTDLLKTKYSDLTQGFEGGAPVTISETAPTDPDEGDLWWADTDEDEGGGRLYVYTGSEWVDTSIPGSGEGGADGNFVDLTTDQTINGTKTFNDPIVGDLKGTADKADALKVSNNGFGVNSNRPVACFGSNSTPSPGSYSPFAYPINNPPTISGEGEITANGGFKGNLEGDVTGDVTGNLDGIAENVRVADQGFDSVQRPIACFGTTFNPVPNSGTKIEYPKDNHPTVKGDGELTANGGFKGNLTGDVTGNLEGDVTGNLTGNVTGDVVGDVTGNLTGNVTGNLTGIASRVAVSTTGNTRPILLGNGNNNTDTDKNVQVPSSADYPRVNGGTGNLTAAGGFTGNLTGDVTGDLTGTASHASRVQQTSISNNKERNILVKNTDDNVDETAATRYTINGPKVNTQSGHLTAPNGFTSSKDCSVNGVNIGKGKNSISSNTRVGSNTLTAITDGDSNSAFGLDVLSKVTSGNNNTGVGFRSLQNTVAGHSNASLGGHSLQNNTSGYENVAVGRSALQKNTTGYASTAIGKDAGVFRTNGNNNTNLKNCTFLGHASRASADNQVQLGDSSTEVYAYGSSIHWRSDARDKTDIRDTLLGLDFIKSLRPVDFRWDYRDDYFDRQDVIRADGEVEPRLVSVTKDGSRSRNRFHHGLIAQEVKTAADAQGVDFAGYQDHSVNGGDDVLSLGYVELIAPLIKAVQELSAENADLRDRVGVLEQWMKETIVEEHNNVTDRDKLEQIIEAKREHLRCSLLCETEYCQSICDTQYSDTLSNILGGN